MPIPHSFALPIVVYLFLLGYVPSSKAILESLREAGKQRGLLIGAAANYGVLTSGEKMYSDTLEQQYSLVTAENACKWTSTEGKGRNEYSFTECDYIENFSSKENQIFRGHNLCWGNYNPGWLSQNNYTSTQLMTILQDHISVVAGHYQDSAYAWDVVNEAIEDGDNGVNGTIYKPTIWSNADTHYVDIAFKAARRALGNNSTVKLMYNDYSVASAKGWSKAKSDRMYNMVKSMLEREIPIDGVGLQLHVDIAYGLVDGVRENVQRLGKLGLEVHFTELDIGCIAKGDKCPSYLNDTFIEKMQAELYASLLHVCLTEPSCKNFETWGFTDKHSWRSGLRALPFDENYSAKPAVRAMLGEYILASMLLLCRTAFCIVCLRAFFSSLFA